MSDGYASTPADIQNKVANGSAGLSKAVRRKLHACVSSSVVVPESKSLAIILLALSDSPICPIKCIESLSERDSSSPAWSSVCPVIRHPPPAVSASWQFFVLISLLSGESGLGKSTLINTLFNTSLYAPKETLPPSAERPKTVAIQSISAGTSFLSLL